MLSINPLIINCDHYSISNGIWEFNLYKNDQRAIGANEKYVLLNDLTLINKQSGKPSDNNKFKGNASQHKRLNKYSYNALAMSKNNRLFASSIVKKKSLWLFEIRSSLVINEISENGDESPIIKILKNTSGSFPVVKMVASDEGEYLFIVVENTRRGPGDLYFYIIDVKNRNVILKKTLEKNARYKENIFLDYQDNKILLSYSSPLKLYLFELKEF